MIDVRQRWREHLERRIEVTKFNLSTSGTYFVSNYIGLVTEHNDEIHVIPAEVVDVRGMQLDAIVRVPVPVLFRAMDEEYWRTHPDELPLKTRGIVRRLDFDADGYGSNVVPLHDLEPAQLEQMYRYPQIEWRVNTDVPAEGFVDDLQDEIDRLRGVNVHV